MDVRHYFNPVDFSSFIDKSLPGNKYLLGTSIAKYTNKVVSENLHKTDIAIFGVPNNNGIWETSKSVTPDSIRKELYHLAKINEKVNIVDFGNLKKNKSPKATYLALRDVVEYFNELGITSVVIGGSQDLSIGICEAFRSDRIFSFSTIDALFDIKKGKESSNSGNYLSKVFSATQNLLQFSLLAFQGHYIAPELFSKMKGVGEHIRLGLLRDNLVSAEPALRNSNFLSFDIGAVKYSETMGGDLKFPNGLRSEEACQLAKYAGLSDNLKVFGLFESNIKKDKSGLTAKLSGQIIWYFLDGFIHRQNENPVTDDNLTYEVEIDTLDNPIKFIKSKKTNRWWMEVISMSNEKIYVACQEEEYLLASKNEIPDYWLNYVQKIDELLK